MTTLFQRAAAAAGALVLATAGAITLTSAASATSVSCSSTTPASARPLVKRGDTGSCVRVLQQRLADRGYSLSVDGVFGPITDNALRRFQASRVGVVIDGQANPTTWSLLVDGGGTSYSKGRGPNLTSKVVLTFDDCPKSYSAFQQTVLDAEALGIRLVLFPYGQCQEWGKISYSYARDHGHYVFNHSYDHADYTKLTQTQVESQLNRGVAGTFGRPPYGAYNFTTQKAFAARGMRIWTWDVDTNDWTGKSQDSVVSYAVANAKAGSTVLMHMQYAAFNKTALTRIKDGLAARGLQVCRNNGPVGSTPQTLDC